MLKTTIGLHPAGPMHLKGEALEQEQSTTCPQKEKQLKEGSILHGVIHIESIIPQHLYKPFHCPSDTNGSSSLSYIVEKYGHKNYDATSHSCRMQNRHYYNRLHLTWIWENRYFKCNHKCLQAWRYKSNFLPHKMGGGRIIINYSWLLSQNSDSGYAILSQPKILAVNASEQYRTQFSGITGITGKNKCYVFITQILVSLSIFFCLQSGGCLKVQKNF